MIIDNMFRYGYKIFKNKKVYSKEYELIILLFEDLCCNRKYFIVNFIEFKLYNLNKYTYFFICLSFNKNKINIERVIKFFIDSFINMYFNNFYIKTKQWKIIEATIIKKFLNTEISLKTDIIIDECNKKMNNRFM